MAKVLLLSVADEDPRDDSFMRGAYTRLKQSADMGKSPHALVDSPTAADIILFAELDDMMFAFNVRQHPYYKTFQEKCFVFSPADQFIPFLPGVYASIEKSRYSPGRIRSGFYLSILENPHTDFDHASTGRDLLYSFVGSVNTSPVRAVLEKLRHPRSLFIDTSRESLPILLAGSTEQRAVFWKKYADVARRSKFVLCPRGLGASSIRLFEMMRMGRAPVILSDEWVPPEGPQWAQFSIRLPESEAMNVPKILEEREGEAAALGLKARQEWERWFAPEAVFNTVVDWCLDIKKSRCLPEGIAQLFVYPQMFRPYFFQAYLRSWKTVFMPHAG